MITAMRRNVGLALLMAVVIVFVTGAAIAKNIDTSVKGSTGTVHFDPAGPYGVQYCDTVKVRNSTDPPIVVTVYTKSDAGVTHESKSINPGAIEAFHAAGEGVADSICVTEAKGSLVTSCEKLLYLRVPSLTTWGLVILLLLLVMSAVYVIYRRRQVAQV